MDIQTHKKGDIAVGVVVADLLKRGFNVFIPVSTHACHYDIVAAFIDSESTEQVIRIQVKYGSFQHEKYHEMSDPFDLYAVYYPDFDRVLYLRFDAVSTKTIKVSHQIPNSATPFFWWEDFQCPKDALDYPPKKRTVKDFGHKIKLGGTQKRESRVTASPASLQRLVWKKSLVLLAKEFGVSDRALGKRVHKFDLVVPPTGYWAHAPAKRKEIRHRYYADYKQRLAELS